MSTVTNRPAKSMQRLIPSEVTGAAFPSLYLVRSYWLARWLARVTFGALVLGMVALIFVPWQQTSRGAGFVIARDPQQRLQPVVAMNDGVVDWIKEGFQEGSFVREGEEVMRLKPFADDETQRVQSQLAQSQNKKVALEIAIDNATLNVALQATAGKNDVNASQAAIDAAEAKVEQSRRLIEELEAEYRAKLYEYNGVRDLTKIGLRSQLEFEKALAEERSAFQKVEKAQQAEIEQFKTLKGKQEEYQSKTQEVDIKNNEAKSKVQSENQKISEVNKEIEDVQIKLGQLDRLTVKASRNGYIQSLQVNSRSDSVKKNDILFEIVPETSELAVKLTIRGNDSPLVHVGDDVRLQFQGWPAVQWVGWPSVAVGTFGGKVNSVNPSGDLKGDFDVYVTPDTRDPSQVGWPDNRYLRQGVRANGWILLKTVPLGYELWRQLNGFPPIIDDPTAGKSGDTKSYGSGSEGEAGKKPKLPK